MSVTRFSPYARPGIFNYRNARTAWNAGQKAGKFAKEYLNRSSNTTPVNVKATKIKTKGPTGRFKKVEKDVITSKKARKAITNVVHSVMNKELELHKTPHLFVEQTCSNRVWNFVDLAAIPQPGDATHQYTGNSIHISSIALTGHLWEITANRGIPSRWEVYVIEKRGGFTSTIVSGVNNFSGNLYNTAEDQITKNVVDGDNTVLGMKAIMAPSLRGYRILSKRVVRVKQNLSYPGTGVVQRIMTTPFDFHMKVDKTIKPAGSYIDEDSVDQKRVFLLYRCMTPDDAYNSTSVAVVRAGLQINFRDA